MREDNFHTSYIIPYFHQIMLPQPTSLHILYTPYQNTQFLAAVQSDLNPNNCEINVQGMDNLQPHYTINNELNGYETINSTFSQPSLVNNYCESNSCEYTFNLNNYNTNYYGSSRGRNERQNKHNHV